MPGLCGGGDRASDAARRGVKFFIDEQLPSALAIWIRTQGHAAEHVLDTFGAATPEEVISDHCERHGLILVSKDADFVLLRQPNRFILVRLVMGNIAKRSLVPLIEENWEDAIRRLAAGERVIAIG